MRQVEIRCFVCCGTWLSQDVPIEAISRELHFSLNRRHFRDVILHLYRKMSVKLAWISHAVRQLIV